MSTDSPNSGASTRPWLLWIAIFAGIILLVLFKERMEPYEDRLSQYQFENLLNSNRIISATISYDNQSLLNDVVGRYYKDENNSKTEVPFRTKVRLTAELEQRLLSSPRFEVRQPNALMLSIVTSILPFLVIAALIWFFFIRQIKRLSGSPAQQQARVSDKILDKWEEQTRRMDAVLDKLDQRRGP